MRGKKTEKTDRFEAFRKRLLSELEDYKKRVERARQEIPVDTEPDDDMGLATRSSYREMTMGNLERYVQTINEIERALSRIEAGQYDVCVACQEQIPDKRLLALPWTRICLECAGGKPKFFPPTLGLNLKHT